MSRPAALLRWAPWLSLGVFTALWAARWETFPLVLDPAYHLLVSQQVAVAGGPISYEWWESAPVGRPHLYPPLLHVLIGGLLKANCPPLVAIRLVSAILVPVLLLSLFATIRRLFTPLLALSCLWMGMIPFSFHLHGTVALAATLGLTLLLWLLVALESRRMVAAGLLLALLFYTHLGLPWLAVLTACGCAILRPALWRRLGTAAWGVILALPWLWHLNRHQDALRPTPRLENTMVDVMPLLLVLAVVGAWRCGQVRGRWLWLLACWAGFLPLAPHFTYRWLSGEGTLPLIMLAGAGTEWIAKRWGVARESHRSEPLACFVVFAALCLSPGLSRTGEGMRWVWPDSGPVRLLAPGWVEPKRLELSVMGRSMEQLAMVVHHETAPGQILWSNAPHAVGLLAALTQRPTSSAMLSEVPNRQRVDAIGAAHLIVWFNLEGPPGMAARQALERHPLTRIAEDEVAIVFRNPAAGELARHPTAVIPLELALGVLALAVGVIVWDLRRL